MARLSVSFVAALLTTSHCIADPSMWTCKPVWSFSAMGNKSYEGSNASEAAAKDLARAGCVNENRGLELDDFCLADPKGNDWHCSQGQEQAARALPKS